MLLRHSYSSVFFSVLSWIFAWVCDGTSFTGVKESWFCGDIRRGNARMSTIFFSLAFPHVAHMWNITRLHPMSGVWFSPLYLAGPSSSFNPSPSPSPHISCRCLPSYSLPSLQPPMTVAHRFVLYAASAQGDIRLPGLRERGFIPKSTLSTDAVAGRLARAGPSRVGGVARGGRDAPVPRKGLLCLGVASREIPLRWPRTLR